MLGLGLGLGKGGFLRTFAQIIFASYKQSVASLGGTLYNSACLIADLVGMQTAGYIKNFTGVLIPSGVREDSVMAQVPIGGGLDTGFTRGSAATYTDSLGNNRTSPDNLFTQSVWSGVGTNVAPSGWSIYTGAGSTTADIAAAGTVDSFNNKMRCFSTAGGRGFIQQSRTWYAGEVYTISVYVDSVTVATTLNEVIGFAGPFSDSAIYYEDSTVVGAGTIIQAGKRYSYSFRATSPATGTLTFRIGGGVTNNSVHDFVISRPMLVFANALMPYVTTTDRQNFPRIDFSNPDGTTSTCGRLIAEQPRTNSIRNNWMVGAVTGSPGTLPTNWLSTTAGLTQRVVETGFENGYRYIDFRFDGTATGTVATIQFDAVTAIAGAVGQNWTNSILAKRVSAPSDANQILLTIYEFNSSSVYLSEGSVNIKSQLTSTLSRFSFTRTLASATVAYTQPLIQFALTNGASYDFTIRIAAPQMELGGYATSPIRGFTAATTRATEALWKNDMYSSDIIGPAGGILFIDLKNTIARVRENTNNAFYLSTAQYGVTGDGLAIRNDSTASARPQIGKYISGVFTSLFTLASDNNKIMFRWNGTSVDVFVNGVKVVTASAFTALTMNNYGFDTVPYPVYIEEIDFGNDPSLWSDANCIAKTT